MIYNGVVIFSTLSCVVLGDEIIRSEILVGGTCKAERVNPTSKRVGWGGGVVCSVEISLKDDGLSGELRLGQLFRYEVAEDFMGGHAFNHGGGITILEGLNSSVKGAGSCANRVWEKVGANKAE